MPNHIRSGLAALAMIFLLAGGAHGGEAKAAKKRLNIVFILADDLGYGDIGCYGNERIKTPNLDRLASDGMRFTQFYTTAPVCTPSRASFLTGRHPQRFRIHGSDLPESSLRYPLPLDAVTIMRLLQQAGYQTAHFGKWHLGEPPLTGMPRRHGLDHFFGFLGGRPSSTWTQYARYDDAQFVLNEEQPKTYPGYATDVMTDHVLKYLDEAAGKDRPFYLNLWYNSPHEPLSPGVKQAALYEGLPEKEKVYYGSVTNLDSNIGKVLLKLAELKVLDNTLILFSSDNGPERLAKAYSAGSAGRLRGNKTQLWEGGVRMPFIVALRGSVPAGKTSDQVASALDFVPTLCEWAGVQPPAKDRLDEGMSLVACLKGTAAPRTRTLFWEYHNPQRGSPASGTLAIRTGDWKLHLWQKEKKRALFDLATDISESNDVSGAHKDRADRMEREALEWFATLPRETGTKMRVPTPATEAEANRIIVEK
jgi:arylsulfatase A-like enzyme